MAEKVFPGFPTRAEVTPIPNLFFSAVMPKIDGIAELKTILHVFWLLSRRRGYPQFVTYGELLSDPVFMGGIEGGAKPKDEVLHQALDQAVQHGTMLYLSIARDGTTEEVYFINNEAAREAINKIQQGEFPQLVVAPRIFSVFMNKILACSRL